MRTLVLSAFAVLAACDITESPGEEAEEAVEAVGDGESLEEVGREVGQVGEAIGDDVEEAADDVKEAADDVKEAGSDGEQ